MKLRILRLFLGLLLLPIFIGIGVAQEPAYLHYGVSDGLPSALVYCGLQDSKGFLWFGTDKGLVRFDGTRFKVFDVRQGLLDNEVLEVFEDSKQRIWMSCFYNNPSYILNNQVHTPESDSLLSKITMKGGALLVNEDSRGNIWITRDQDKCCKLSPDGQLSYRYSPLELLNEKLPFPDRDKKVTIYQVFDIGGETYLIAGGSILHFESDGKLKKAFEFDINRDISFNSLAVSGNHILLSFSNSITLMSYEDCNFKIIDIFEENVAGKISSDRKGRFWVSTINKGAICFEHQNNKLSKPVYYLKGQKVTNTFEDNEGTMWFSTLNDGLFALPRNAAIKYTVEGGSPFQSNNFISITKLNNDQIVFGDDTGNLFFRKNNGWEKISIGSDDGYNRVLQILPFPDGTWLAVSEETLYSSKTGKLKGELGLGALKSAYLTANNNIWLGTSHGLLVKANKEGKPKRILNSRTTSITMDTDSFIWVGGLNGMYSNKDSFQTNWGDYFKPLSRRIISIKSAGVNKLLVATSNYGLLEVGLSNGKVKSIKILNNSLTTPIENIQSLFIESNEKVWLSSNTGVYSLDRQSNVQNLSEVNGLVSNNVNAVLVYKDTLWVATVAGISRFILKDGTESSDFKTQMTGLRYNLGSKNIEVDLTSNQKNTKEITLPADATMLEIDFAALYYRTRGNLQFKYTTQKQLMPIHLLTFGNLFDWILGKTYRATIVHSSTQNYGANLACGRFICTVTAMLPDGTSSTQPDCLIITVLPHWWETIWFSLILLALTTFGIVRIFKARSAFLKLQGTASELQLQAIKSQMNPHFVGNSINAIQQFFYPPDPVKASEYISIFSDLLRRTMDFAEVDFIPFKEEIAYLKDYLEMVKLRFGDRFNYEIIGEGDVQEETKFPAMLLQPILENATIHGLSLEGTSELTIHFKQQHDIITCTATDNGVGINESLLRKSQMSVQRPSRGLKLLDKKMQMLNQLHNLNLKIITNDLSVLDKSKHGTQVIITFSNILNYEP